ncbi:MAG: ATP-binding cassette domain-containing protein [Clostridiales bacterium]|nr:ATP-binding cassette domain-containing protein [Clostridiales bacterium]
MHLEVNNLKKNFGDKEVLHGLSFNVTSGKALGLLGRNGAGKTTTIRILMDLFQANNGTILLNGNTFKPREFQIGYLPEERGLYPKKKVYDQLIYLGKLRGLSKSELKENTLYWLNRLGVMEYKDKKLETLSKGNQQKVQLASTFLCHPEIIILDEPFSGLDPVNSQILKEIIREQIQSEKLVIFSSHLMSYVEEFCEEIALIDEGQMILSGNLNTIKREYGRNRIIMKLVDTSPQHVYDLLKRDFSDLLKFHEIKKDHVILELVNENSKYQFMSRLSEKKMDVEKFAIYHPSLEDIFIERVGE